MSANIALALFNRITLKSELWALGATAATHTAPTMVRMICELALTAITALHTALCFVSSVGLFRNEIVTAAMSTEMVVSTIAETLSIRRTRAMLFIE